MTIQVTCQCGKSFRARPELAGKRIKCPACGEGFVVPSPAKSDSIPVTCLCGKSYRAQADLAGKTLNCPACSQSIQVPLGNAAQTVRAAAGPLDLGLISENEAMAGAGQAAQPMGYTASGTQPAKSSDRNWALIGAVAAGCTVLGASLVMGVLWLTSGSSDKQVAQAPPPPRMPSDRTSRRRKAQQDNGREAERANQDQPAKEGQPPKEAAKQPDVSSLAKNFRPKKSPPPKPKKKTKTAVAPLNLTKKTIPALGKSHAAPTTDGQLSGDVLKKVKAATVFVKTTHNSGSAASGSGFLVLDQSVVVTNAHVVGMLEPGTSPPEEIRVIVHSGETNEFALPAQIMGIDRKSDLAILLLKIGNGEKSKMPEPLGVASALSLKETQPVYVFGFPFGERLGKNITVSKTSVSSLRKERGGRVKQVQVNGGMHPGNSGGPVVDSSGKVVGVAVAVIMGTQVNFAIPGDDVHALLRGRVSEIAFGESTQRQKQLQVPVSINTIDPLRQIKSVTVEWWMGKPGTSVASSATQPSPGPDDSDRQSAAATYTDGTARTVLTLPQVAKGKTFFVQAVVSHQDGTQVWTESKQYNPSPIVELQPIMLVNKHQRGSRQIHLNSKSVLKFIGYDVSEQSLLAHIDARLLQTTQMNGNRATKRYGVGRMQLGLSINNQAASDASVAEHVQRPQRSADGRNGKQTRQYRPTTGRRCQNAPLLSLSRWRAGTKNDAVA